MKMVLAVCAVLLSAATAPQASARAQTGTDPARFALASTEFPQPAQVLKSRVENNDEATVDEPTSSGPRSLAQEGRLTGYFMEVAQPNADNAGRVHTVFTMYLVSMFGSTDQARQAYAQQQNAWEAELATPNTRTGPLRYDISAKRLGDVGAAAMYSVTLPGPGGATNLVELLFARGPMFMQVWQEVLLDDEPTYGKAAAPFVFSIARSLDTLANSANRAPALAPVRAADTGVAFALLSVRAERQKAMPDLQLKRAPLREVRAGTVVALSAYFTVKSAPPSAPFVARYTVSRDGVQLAQRDFPETLGAEPASTYRMSIPYRLDTPGTYVIAVRIAIQGVGHSGKTTLVVSR